MAKSSLSKTKQFTNTGLICAIAACTPILTSEIRAQESLLQQEINRRASNANTAQELLLSGDTAYHKQDYETAVKDYAEAFRLMPTGTLNTELRSAVADRYATAATERSRRLVKFGHYDEARDLLDGVLNPKVAPHHLGAKKLIQQMDDPIRYNPALTGDHVNDVVKVGQLLREGEGFYSLGQYDRAQEAYHEVLQIDPYNTAARRALERVNQAQAKYQKAARDQARASLLNDVDKQWESPVSPTTPLLPAEYTLTPNSSTSTAQDSLSNIIEQISLDQVSIEEALDFVRVQSKLSNTPNILGEQNGLNIILNLGQGDTPVAQSIKDSKISIQATNLPLSVVLDYIAEQTATKWENDGTVIQFSPLHSGSTKLISRTFRVPPTFLTSSSSTESDSAESIFADDSDSLAGKLAARIGAQEYLEKHGISFPDGASAKYIPSSNSLIVKNTADNVNSIEEIVTLAASTEPFQIVTRTTIIRISETKLKELGFDWLLSPVGLGSSILSGGANDTDGLIGVENPAPALSLGLRSGSAKSLTNALDTFLNSEDSGFSPVEARAPAILSLSHVISGAQLQVIMRGLNQSTGSDIVVQPSVVSRSGQRASVNSVREIIYPTEYEPPEVADTPAGNNQGGNGGTIFIDAFGNTITPPANTFATPSHPTAFTSRKVGVNLEVEASVDDTKNYINLSLFPELVEFEGFVNYGSPILGTSGASVGQGVLAGLPSFVSLPGNFGEITPNDILLPIFKTITTGNITTTIQDGDTVVLAGLVTSNKTKTVDKIPLLGDLPVAGRLFRTEGSNTSKQAVIVMVNSEIIDPTGKLWRDR